MMMMMMKLHVDDDKVTTQIHQYKRIKMDKYKRNFSLKKDKNLVTECNSLVIFTKLKTFWGRFNFQIHNNHKIGLESKTFYV